MKVDVDPTTLRGAGLAQCAEIARSSPPPDVRSSENRRSIAIGHDEHRVNDEALAALADERDIYSRAGSLVRIVSDDVRPPLLWRPSGAPYIEQIPSATIRELLTRAADWSRRNARGEMVEAHPPGWCVSALMARRELAGIRPLEGVTTTPVFRPDGTVLDVPGYDVATGLVYQPIGATPEIPAHPSREEAIGAAERLLDAVADFPFATPAHRAAWLAATLTPVARYAIAGDCPFVLVDANVKGAGKGLLVDVTSLLATGSLMARGPLPHTDDEMRKRITAIAIAGHTMVLFDNVSGVIAFPALEAALTCQGEWSDRVLGESTARRWPLRTVWLATGNNVALSTDTARRTLHIRLKSPLERPEEREGFQHGNLRAWVREHREALFAACLTILRAFHLAGRPQSPLPPWGSFEEWSALVRQAVVWLGLPDPAETREELRRSVDIEVGALRALVEGIAELTPDGTSISAAEMLKRLEDEPIGLERLRGALVELCPPAPGNRLPSAKSVGRKLGQLRERVIDGRCLDSHDGRTGSARWFVRSM